MGHRDGTLVPRDNRHEDTSGAKLEQPAREQDRRPPGVPMPSRTGCNPVSELRDVFLRPVVNSTAADQLARFRVRDRERNARGYSSRSELSPGQRELLDDGLGLRRGDRRSRVPSPVVFPVVASDRWVGACYRHEPRIIS